MRLELITPAIAQSMLDKHDISGQTQRVPNKRNIERLAKVMTSGHFHGELAEAIAVTKDGGIINGRHRLLAVIESGTTQQMVVVNDADAEAFKYLDNIGKVRNNADILKLNGFEYYTEKASAFKTVDVYKRQSPNIGGASNLIGFEIIDAVEEYGDEYVNVLAKAANVISSNNKFSKSIALAGLIIAFEDDKTNTELLSEWVDGVAHLKGLYEDDPRAVLYKYSLHAKSEGKGSSSRTYDNDFYTWIYLWNKWVVGAPAKRAPSLKKIKYLPITPITAYNEDR